jgi:hypothetical protein
MNRRGRRSRVSAAGPSDHCKYDSYNGDYDKAGQDCSTQQFVLPIRIVAAFHTSGNRMREKMFRAAVGEKCWASASQKEMLMHPPDE